MTDSAARAARYRNKAEEILAIAASVKDAVARQVLKGVASDYTALAQMVERSHPTEAMPAVEPPNVQNKA